MEGEQILENNGRGEQWIRMRLGEGVGSEEERRRK